MIGYTDKLHTHVSGSCMPSCVGVLKAFAHISSLMAHTTLAEEWSILALF